jgi:hypothetical protein
MFGSAEPIPSPMADSRGFPMREFLRGVNEGLVIDDDWEITVLDIQPDHVRLAIVSACETPSYREEIIYLDEPGLDSDLKLVESSIP